MAASVGHLAMLKLSIKNLPEQKVSNCHQKYSKGGGSLGSYERVFHKLGAAMKKAFPWSLVKYSCKVTGLEDSSQHLKTQGRF